MAVARIVVAIGVIAIAESGIITIIATEQVITRNSEKEQPFGSMP